MDRASCSSHCGSNLPITTVRITATVNVNPHPDVAWDGRRAHVPAHLPRRRRTTFCTHLDVAGHAEGICDVMIAFTDRPSMAIRTQFGPATTRDAAAATRSSAIRLFTIPVASDAGIYGGDGSSDAVSLSRRR